MKFDKLDHEEIIYNKGDWAASRSNYRDSMLWIYKADYNKDLYLPCGYVHYSDRLIPDDTPEDLESLLLREVI